MSPIQAVGLALIHFLWQGAVIGLALAVSLRLFRGASPRFRYLLSLTALVAMPAAAGVTAIRGLARSGTPTEPRLTAGADLTGAGADLDRSRSSDVVGPVLSGESPARPELSAAAAPAPGAALERVLPWLVGLWLLGVAMLAVRQLVGWRAAHRLTRLGIGPAPAAWVEAAERLARRLRVRQRVTLLVSSVARVPAVIGWLRPVVLVPLGVLSGLTPAQLELLLAHELAHVRRLDFLVNLFQSALESLLFYHPAIWWVSAKVRDEREQCCDDLAVSVSGDAMAYARALVAMEELRVLAPRHPALAATGGSLLPRIRRLVKGPEREIEHFPRWIAGAVLSVGLVMSAAGVRWAAASARPAAPIKSAEHAVTDGAVIPASQSPAQPGNQEPRAMAPDTVLRHPDPDAPLTERFAWAEAQARRYRAYWIGYSIAPLFPGGTRSIYVGRVLGQGIKGNGFTLTGRIVNFGDFENIRIPGIPVLKLVGGRPDDIAILLGFGGRAASGLTRVQASSAALPADFERRPLIWLGRAEDDESVPLLVRLRAGPASADARDDLVGALGVHRTAAVVVPELTGILRGSEPDEVRASAAEWLGWHPDPRALAVLARTARSDRAARVRRDAAEAVGDVDLPEAADTLIALARTLDDREARREAVEALGQRKEASAVPALLGVARDDRDLDIRREAAETLGDFEDHRGLAALLQLAETHRDIDVRREAVETIASAAEPAEAVRVLERLARGDDQVEIQREAVETLGDIEGGAGAEALERLSRDHPVAEVRREAIETLGSADPDKAFDLLRRIARDDRSAEVRREAVESLGELEDPRVVAELLAIARGDDEAEVLREAAESLGSSDDPKALEALAQLAATHPDEDVRAEAVETYGETAPAAAAAWLFRKLIGSESAERVQHEILESLAELDGNAGVPFLSELARTHPNRKIRSAAIKRLGDVDDDAARDLLVKLIEKP